MYFHNCPAASLNIIVFKNLHKAVCGYIFFSLAISFGMNAALENFWLGWAHEEYTEARIN